MLTAIDGETLHWTCLLYDEGGDLVSCGEEKQTHISEARYLAQSDDRQRGPVIALPRCGCGVQMFLKADYSIKDASRCCLPVVNDAGQTWAYAMKLGHARNLLMHWMLYERGEASIPPCIDRPPIGASIDGVPHEVFSALWFASVASKHTGQTLDTTMNMSYRLKSA